MKDQILRDLLLSSGILKRIAPDGDLRAMSCASVNNVNRISDDYIELIDGVERLVRNQELIMNFLNIKVDEEPRLVQNVIRAVPDPPKQ